MAWVVIAQHPPLTVLFVVAKRVIPAVARTPFVVILMSVPVILAVLVANARRQTWMAFIVRVLQALKVAGLTGRAQTSTNVPTTPAVLEVLARRLRWMAFSVLARQVSKVAGLIVLVRIRMNVMLFRVALAGFAPPPISMGTIVIAMPVITEEVAMLLVSILTNV